MNRLKFRVWDADQGCFVYDVGISLLVKLLSGTALQNV